MQSSGTADIRAHFSDSTKFPAARFKQVWRSDESRFRRRMRSGQQFSSVTQNCDLLSRLRNCGISVATEALRQTCCLVKNALYAGAPHSSWLVFRCLHPILTTSVESKTSAFHSKIMSMQIIQNCMTKKSWDHRSAPMAQYCFSDAELFPVYEKMRHFRLRPVCYSILMADMTEE